MIQLILHLIGDYVTQSDWMAHNKTKANLPAACHAVVYSLPFLFIVDSAWAIFVICFTHYLIDRYRLARYIVWLKNRLLQPKPYAYEQPARFEWDEKWKWSNCSSTGYTSDAPPWLAVWLLIAADNTLHLAINAAAIAWL